MQMFEMVFDLLVKKLVVETKQYSPLRAKFWSCMHLLPFWILQRDIANAVNHRILCDVHPNLIAFPIFIMLHKLRLPGWIGMKCIVICQCADSTRKAQHTDYFTEWTVKACLQHLNSTELELHVQNHDFELQLLWQWNSSTECIFISCSRTTVCGVTNES